MPAIDQLLEANAGYARDFPAGLSQRPRLGLAVVACMDARLDLSRALGLTAGDAHLIRNAGGQITDDVLRSLAISQRSLGTREVMLVKHTDCGLLRFNDDAFRAELTAESGVAPSWRVPGFTDLAADVRAGERRVRECPWLPCHDQVRGFVFDVQTGRLDEIA